VLSPHDGLQPAARVAGSRPRPVQGMPQQRRTIEAMPSSTPFFIVGCGRSGTSLLRGMLNRHPQVAIPLESLFMIDYLRVEQRFELDWLKALLVTEPEIHEWGLYPSVEDIKDCGTVADAISRLHELYTASQGAEIWGEKTPRFVRDLDLLHEHFPGARFVHLIRDPRAVANSLIQSDVHRSDAFHAAQRWKKDVEHGLAFEVSNPDVTLQVKYEDLVSDPGAVLRTIMDFLGLPYADLESEKRVPGGAEEYSEFYAHIHANLDIRPSTKFVDKWVSQMSARDLEVVEAVCRDMMVKLGYDPKLSSPRLKATVVTWMKIKRLLLAILQAMRYLRYRRAYFIRLLWRKWKLGLLWEFLWTVNY